MSAPVSSIQVLPSLTHGEPLEFLKKHWGYTSFRPFQGDAIQTVLDRQDSLIVLPTGGGKSLCFQIPALCLPGLAVVVSPLISLMKDQVDTLQSNGIPAAYINSTQSADVQRQIATQIQRGELKLLYLAPERLLTEKMIRFLQQVVVSFVAIDESHCISDWGHDFRPEYRGLKALKDRLNGVAVHAYTATASAEVREDIVRQLGLIEPQILVGKFDRPNLVYRVQPVSKSLNQVIEVVQRHAGESGIIYCISRKEVERVAGALEALGYRVGIYHAGLDDLSRKKNQEAFVRGEIDMIVATVAFGMGIDKPDVRFVVHAEMPKSIEHYQQESGRAGRDGLEAECVLLYSAGDLLVWKRILENNDASDDDFQKMMQGSLPENTPKDQGKSGAQRALDLVFRFCGSCTCRHQALSSYFGQTLDQENCGACDVCLGELEFMENALTIGQMILSCVMRLQQRFGADYTAKVLVGLTEQRIKDLQHDQLSTFGLLKEHSIKEVRQWIDQLTQQEFLSREGSYQVLQVTERGRQLLRGELTPALSKPSTSSAPRQALNVANWEGVDRGLFEQLKELRKRLATERSLPAYTIFGDATLREMAQCRPSSLSKLRSIRGVGDKKLTEFGPLFSEAIVAYCQHQSLAMDQPVLFPTRGEAPLPPSLNAGSLQAAKLFRSGKSVQEVAAQMGRALSTVNGYLREFIALDRIQDPSAWVPAEATTEIEASSQLAAEGRLKPLFEHFAGKYTYDQLAIVVTCQRNRLATPTE